MQAIPQLEPTIFNVLLCVFLCFVILAALCVLVFTFVKLGHSKVSADHEETDTNDYSHYFNNQKNLNL